MKRVIALLSFVILVSSTGIQADVVKQSKSGICHDSSSSYYQRTKNFTAYNTLEQCLQAGGRLPKGSSLGLHVTNKETGSGYNRSQFGNWIDKDRDCINTRHELLMKLSTSTIDHGANKCTAERGRWLDPYTGKTFYNARDMEVDHLVPLKWAWDHSADKWSKEKRVKFTNDEANLFAVQASVNGEKGAQGVLDWLPPETSFHCQYVLRFTRVVKSYGLVLSSYEQKQFRELKDQKCGK